MLAEATIVDETMIQNAADALQEAMDALEELPEEPELDLSLLTFLINEAKDLQQSEYKAESYALFDAAFKVAQRVHDAPQSQAEIDQAVDTLNEAYLNLRLLPNAGKVNSLPTE